MIRMRLTLALALLTLAACTPDDGLGDGDSTDDGDVNPNPHATFRTRAQFSETCGAGATHVRLVATRVDCVVPTPCTKQTNPYLEYVGDAEACPFEAEIDLAVEVLQNGKYRVDLVGSLDGGDELRLCQGIGKVDEHLVTTQDLEARAEFVVGTLDGAACPIP